MSKYPCPNCKAALDVDEMLKGKVHISCPSCSLHGIFDGTHGPDVAVMEFGCSFDSGLLKKESERIQDSVPGAVRKESEIAEMIGSQNPDEITKSVLYSKKDYISCYKKMSRPEPEMGSGADKLGIDGRIVGALAKSGITGLYEYQSRAIESILAGNDTVIEAPTASGKTEAFLVPVLHMVCTQHTGGPQALIIYPTKALARDQMPKIEALARAAELCAERFDGDTSSVHRRRIISERPDIIVTNFDVLHYHMMRRTPFASLLSGIRFAVIDEVHTYTGIFGSNVHYIIKRLKRIAKERIQFTASSATLRGSERFCSALFGTKMAHVVGKGAKSDIDFVMSYPSLRTQRSLMLDLVKKTTAKKHKTMVFSGSQQGAELLAVRAKKGGVAIKVHRAGLSSAYRRAVEDEFRDGSLLAISCTPTLELGIDIGDVDGVISSTVPVDRLMQRIGRAARKGQTGFAFMALGSDPISQYYRNHPDDYFEDIRQAHIDPSNSHVEESQVLAMAGDMPIGRGQMPEHKEAVQRLAESRNIILHGGAYVPGARGQRRLAEYSIRGTGGHVDIVFRGRIIGERALPIALEELHEGAVYFLGGSKYMVRHLYYPDRQRAVLERISQDHPYYTRALTDEWPSIEKIYGKRSAFGVEIAYCRLRIEKTVHGYATVKIGDEMMQGEKTSLVKPLRYDFVTKGIVFHAPHPAECSQSANDAEYAEISGYHAAEHVVIEGSNMIIGGASQDLGGISVGRSGMIFVYDGAVGGSGASKALYERFEEAAARSMSILSECPCIGEAGCPRCTFSYRCGNNNEYLHKASALEVFERICGGEKTALTDHGDGGRPLV